MDVLTPTDDAGQNASYTGTAGTTNAFKSGARAALVWCTTDAYISVGVGVTATTADTPVPAYTPVLVHTKGGSNEPWVVSAIQVSAAGTVYAKAMQG